MARKSVTLNQPQWSGDTGPDTAAQMAGAVLTEPAGLASNNPNRVRQKRREDVLNRMHHGDSRSRPVLSMRQYQAGKAIQDAYEACEALSSGGPLKEQVDSTPVPDRFIAAQVDAQAELKNAMAEVGSLDRPAIECVCWYNLPLSAIGKGGAYRSNRRTLCTALDRVADRLGF